MKQDDFAVVLKSLELRAEDQGKELDEALREARQEADEWEELALLATSQVAMTSTSSATSSEARLSTAPTRNWNDLVSDAEARLNKRGINPEDIQLKRSTHALDAIDCLAAVLIGGIGAVVPSVGGRHHSITKLFSRVQSLADHGKLPEYLQAIFGNHKDPIMDSVRGPLHRFIKGHDLIAILPEMARSYGFLPGVMRTFQHLAKDSFGVTGIPLPGTNALGDRLASVLGHESIAEVIRPGTLSRYSAFRMTDAISTTTTSILLWGYNSVRAIPDSSLRKHKLALLTHGFCATAVAIAATIPGLAPTFAGRSHVNYLSLAAMTKNAWQLWRGIESHRLSNDAAYSRISADLRKLQDARAATQERPKIEDEIEKLALKLSGTEE